MRGKLKNFKISSMYVLLFCASPDVLSNAVAMSIGVKLDDFRLQLYKYQEGPEGLCILNSYQWRALEYSGR